MRRLVILCLTTVLVALGAAVPASAQAPFPDILPLPIGSYPEDIEVGTGATFYVGSLLNGAIYGGDLRTGTGSVVVPGEEGRAVAGLTFDSSSGLLWGVGFEDGAGAVFVFDPAAGALLDVVLLPDDGVPGSLPNDVVIADGTVYVTDSLSAVLWTIPLDRRGLPAAGASALPLSGDFQFVTEGELPINLNGIVATPNGDDLIAVHSTLGVLYRIDPDTGAATLIDVPLDPGTGQALPSADGLLLHGRTLYVVQNFLNQLAVVELAPDLASGAVVETRTSDLFRVPTAVARFGSSLYLVNARFDVSLPPLFTGVVDVLDYEVVRIDR